MTKENLPVNSNEEKKLNTVIRVVHNRENPFVQINKHAINDPNLSLKARGLFATCMCKPDDWKFSVNQLVKNLKEGRKAVDSAIKELRDNRYAMRFIYSEKTVGGKFQNKCTEYIFFEFPYTEEDEKNQIEFFKKSFPNCHFGKVGCGDFRDGDFQKGNLGESLETPLLETNAPHSIYTEKDLTDINTSLKVPTENEKAADAGAADAGAAKAADVDLEKIPSLKKNKPSVVSDEILQIGDKMIEALKEIKPDYSAPRNVTPFLTHIDFMVRLDKREPQKILDVFRWALADTFWASKMYKKNPAEYLREKFDSLEMQMSAKPAQKERKFAPSSNDARSLEKMKKWTELAL